METIYTNCSLVTRDAVFRGTIVVADASIKEIDRGMYHGKDAVDLNGDMLLPGLIEVHTDNLEKNIQPRPGVIWPSIITAAMAHDAQIAGAGITTVFDALAVGGLRESSLRSRIFNDSIGALCRGNSLGIFKADHFLHLRCEISDDQMEKMLWPHRDNPTIRLISLMDHTPGQRQWSDLAKWRLYHRDKNWTDTEAAAVFAERLEMQQRHAKRHRRIAVAIAGERGIPLASHDDTTIDDIATAVEEGIKIAEFPTTLEAAELAAKVGLKIVMGAPNAIRGGSHSGNISALVLAERGHLDALSSDYVPASLLHAAFHLTASLDIPLPQTIAMVSCNIAEMTGFIDRGELAPGKRADLLQVSMIDTLPVLRKVFKKGVQIA